MRKILVLFLILLSATCFGATRQKTWSTGDTITENDMNADWNNFYSEKITASNIANGAVGNNQLGTITTANKINFSSVFTAGQAQGDTIYYNGSAWTRLGTGTAGQALISGGAAANPSWGGALPWTNVLWVVYTPSTGAVLDCYPAGVTVTNTGVGDETINFPSNFSNTNYAVIVGNGRGAAMNTTTYGTKAVGSVRIYNWSSGGGASDSDEVSVMCLGD